MKISKRKKLDILFIFVVFLIIEVISLITYETVVLAQVNNKNTIGEQIVEGYENLSEEEKEVLYYINNYRKENGLEELKPFSDLQTIAKIKAEDLVNNNYFAHTSSMLGTPFEMLQSNGVEYEVAGENLAGNVNAQRAVEAWINSPSHKENILDTDYQYTGISVIDSPVYGKMFVQIFIGIE